MAARRPPAPSAAACAPGPAPAPAATPATAGEAPQAAAREGAGPAAAALRTLRIDLCWDGTDFLGWQRQARGRTVQGELEAALARVLGAAHPVVGAGRTDAGVHARRAVASLRTAHAIAPARLARALEALLPRDIGIRTVREAAPGFHALRDAQWKWYRYDLLVASGRRPLAERRAWRVRSLPPLEALGAAARPLHGTLDAASLASAGSPREDTVRTLWRVRWSARGPRTWLDVVGDGFLYKMVRTMVGTMLEAAREADPAARVAAVLAARDRAAAGPPAPAHGLCLQDVGYGGRPWPA